MPYLSAKRVAKLAYRYNSTSQESISLGQLVKCKMDIMRHKLRTEYAKAERIIKNVAHNSNYKVSASDKIIQVIVSLYD